METDDRERQPYTRVRRPKKEEIRRRLIQAATEIFAVKGLEKATLEEISEAAGFSKGAVYSNFENKDDLFIALIEEKIDERIATIDTALSKQNEIGEKIRNFGRSFWNLSLMDPEWQILFIEYWLRAARNPMLRDRFLVRRRIMRDKIAQNIEKHSAAYAEAIGLSPSQYAVIILALSNGLGIEQIIDPEAGQGELLTRVLSLLFQDGQSAQRSQP